MRQATNWDRDGWVPCVVLCCFGSQGCCFVLLPHFNTNNVSYRRDMWLGRPELRSNHQIEKLISGAMLALVWYWIVNDAVELISSSDKVAIYVQEAHLVLIDRFYRVENCNSTGHWSVRLISEWKKQNSHCTQNNATTNKFEGNWKDQLAIFFWQLGCLGDCSLALMLLQCSNGLRFDCMFALSVDDTN